MPRTSAKRGRARPPGASLPVVEPVPDHEPPPPAVDPHATPTCTVGFCPICLAVTALQPMRPDVLEHMLNAGRELLLAARSVLDARAEATTEGDGEPARLEKIDIG